MQVKSIAECSKGSILQYFGPLLKGMATLKANVSKLQVLVKSCNILQTQPKSNEK